MRKMNMLVGLFVAVSVALAAQSTPTSPQAGPPRAGGPGTRGRGAPPANSPANPTDTFGTVDTLYTMPEAGQGGAANDPTAEQLAASPEAQAIIANAKRIAGADLAAEANRFCTWNATAVVPPGNSPEMVQVFDNLYYATTGAVGAWVIKTNAGLILWDTLDSEDEAKNILEAGM